MIQSPSRDCPATKSGEHGFFCRDDGALFCGECLMTFAIEVIINKLPDEAEVEQLDRMFGSGEWVCCIGCPMSPKWCAYHHRKNPCGNQKTP